MFSFAANAVSQVVSECARHMIAADVEESIKSGGLAAIKTERIKVRWPQTRSGYQDGLGLCIKMHWDCVSRCKEDVLQQALCRCVVQRAYCNYHRLLLSRHVQMPC